MRPGRGPERAPETVARPALLPPPVPLLPGVRSGGKAIWPAALPPGRPDARGRPAPKSGTGDTDRLATLAGHRLRLDSDGLLPTRRLAPAPWHGGPETGMARSSHHLP